MSEITNEMLEQLAKTVWSSSESFNEMRSDPTTIIYLARDVLDLRKQNAELQKKLDAANEKGIASHNDAESLYHYVKHKSYCS